MFALIERKKQRKFFFEQNRDQIKNKVAHGRGDHLEILSWFSMCEDQVQNSFNHTLKKISTLISQKTAALFQMSSKSIRCCRGIGREK
ncbi:MAG: hypothetical protein A2622_07485 [Bdellovibrionales bacterium RIFCSPHIGHO2_01_FULL_40_29]|nr:MAG: hypothetical protein A2622_07485 [Bdellovibrionales bacterium RIFCSPHIGHO2_01_FULL_40_29]OFZ34235.1 MAG: hypothetical protein A3D17_04165 [Bdellovibrionales bacterium RIFCSPHIGHO2_02_FULL_40_15]